MEQTDLVSRRRTFDVPPKPEAGLAEWTSKIKALQRQVDEDEEVETKRLEAEIAASRIARMRRSVGRGTSTDLSKSDVAAALKEKDPSDAAHADAIEEPRNTEDRQRNQDDALKKLSGTDSSTRSQADYNGYIASKAATSGAGAPVSLAAFIGGKAPGPRLNKHAPQQDAHDPTQFAQRPITGPHPIFGRGGIAMPGMVTRTRAGSHEKREERSPARPLSSRTPDKDVLGNSSPIESSRVGSFVGKVEKPRGNGRPAFLGAEQPEASRVRTTSTPNTTPPFRTSFTPPAQERKVERPPSRPLSYSPSPAKELSRPITPKERGSPSTTNVLPSRTSTASPARRSPPIRSPSPSKSPSLGSMPGLAKPIQPRPRKSFQGPQVPLSTESTASFLRTPTTKETTPSISRLQGRGFVQSIVRATSQFEANTIPNSPSSADRTKEPPRKSSVLDRWQHGGDLPSVIAPKPVPMRKSRTVDPALSSHTGSTTPVQVFPTYTPSPKSDTGITLRSRASFPSLSSSQDQSPSQRNDAITDSPTPSQRRNLGSSTTMVSYIKPLKTGDGPSSPPARPPSVASRGRPTTPGVDELGVRVRSRTRSIGASSREGEDKRSETPGAGAGGKPLSHPTKSRPQKPRKAKTTVTFAPTVTNVGFETEKEIGSNRVVGSSVVATSRTSALAIETAKYGSPPKTPEDKVDEKSSNRSESPPTPGASRRVRFPLDLPPPQPQPQQSLERSPATPVKHGRIPSTGNRATVMEVAQVFNEHGQLATSPADAAKSPNEDQAQPLVASPASEEEAPVKLDVKSMVASWGIQVTSAPAPLERRKSSYEKYSAFTLPPLVEEKTPLSSPAGTLMRNVAPPSIETVIEEAKPAAPVAEAQPLAQEEPPVPEKQEVPIIEDNYIHINYSEEDPLPVIDVDALLAVDTIYKPNTDAQAISTEVMSIIGSTASAIIQGSNVFYDTELLAIIHRFKTKSSGLVSTKVWAWRGAKSQAGEREERKLQELARRYNTQLLFVKQYAEPPELGHLLGGQLATRQGTRAHWSADNTAMHLVRCADGLTYIDELELSITNLCSAFSYCLSLLETFYVWHGRGSTSEERQAALAYAKSLSSNVIEFSEEAADEDEMFWIILGEGDYGKADYWQWKASHQPWSTRIWIVDADKGNEAISLVQSITEVDSTTTHVYLIDCIWEYFILVGSGARGQRRSIRLALNTAAAMSAKLASTRPYLPSVHALILPSRLPVDLRLTFRDMSEEHLNQGNIPDHMNLLPVTEAFEHLDKSSWRRSALKDPDMLPLGFLSAH